MVLKLQVALLCLVGMCSCKSEAKPQHASKSPTSDNTLPVLVRDEGGPKYHRKEWLPSWGDEDGDGMNTRHELLLKLSEGEVEFNHKGDKVYRGTWTCPYTGIVYHDPRKVDIEHVIPLKEAHESGGWQWSADEKTQFANGWTDSLELLVAQKQANQDKGDKDPADWLPPNSAYICAYLERWSLLKSKHKLSMDQREFDTIQHELEQCRARGVDVPALVVAKP